MASPKTMLPPSTNPAGPGFAYSAYVDQKHGLKPNSRPPQSYGFYKPTEPRYRPTPLVFVPASQTPEDNVEAGSPPVSSSPSDKSRVGPPPTSPAPSPPVGVRRSVRLNSSPDYLAPPSDSPLTLSESSAPYRHTHETYSAELLGLLDSPLDGPTTPGGTRPRQPRARLSTPRRPPSVEGRDTNVTGRPSSVPAGVQYIDPRKSSGDLECSPSVPGELGRDVDLSSSLDASRVEGGSRKRSRSSIESDVSLVEAGRPPRKRFRSLREGRLGRLAARLTRPLRHSKHKILTGIQIASAAAIPVGAGLSLAGAIVGLASIGNLGATSIVAVALFGAGIAVMAAAVVVFLLATLAKMILKRREKSAEKDASALEGMRYEPVPTEDPDKKDDHTVIEFPDMGTVRDRG